MSFTVKYMRYYSAGEYEAESLGEAIIVAMTAIDHGDFAPEQILGPDGEVLVSDEALGDMYARQWGAIPTEDIIAQASRAAADKLDEAMG